VPVDEWDKAAKAADIGFANTAYWMRPWVPWRRSFGVAVAYDNGQMPTPRGFWLVSSILGQRRDLNGGWPALSMSGFPAGAEPSRRFGRPQAKGQWAWSIARP